MSLESFRLNRDGSSPEHSNAADDDADNDAIDVEMAALEEHLAKVRHLKQGMMQELLTGRIRLV